MDWRKINLMEKGKSKPQNSIHHLTSSLHNLQLQQFTNPKSSPNSTSEFQFFRVKSAPPSLLNLCLGVVGANLEDIIDDLSEIAFTFPSDIRLVLVAIARRRNLLNDDVVISLADSSWERLDLSGSDISDSGLCHIVNICHNLRVLDISRCSRLTSNGVSELLQKCHSLEILRWGGCPKSDYIARRCFSLLKPNLNDVEGESWEELDATDLVHGAQSLRWLVWPKVDKEIQESLAAECPRIVVNPKPSLFGFRGAEVPREAVLEYILDDPIVKDIDPKTWAVSGLTKGTSLLPVSSTSELSIAEKFRLAFVERDTRLAPKRAKNARQHQRRAEREWVTTSTRAKAVALASQATKSINLRNL